MNELLFNSDPRLLTQAARVLSVLAVVDFVDEPSVSLSGEILSPETPPPESA